MGCCWPVRYLCKDHVLDLGFESGVSMPPLTGYFSYPAPVDFCIQVEIDGLGIGHSGFICLVYTWDEIRDMLSHRGDYFCFSGI